MNTDTAVDNEPSITILLKQYGLTPEQIGVRAGCTSEDVYKALQPELFDTCPLILVARVWSIVETELSARGWQGDNKQLWSGFNARLRELAANR